MANFKIIYNGKSKVIRRLCERVNLLVTLGETHDTAFYGDLGQIAYEHSQEKGNAHGMTADDLDLGDIPRQVEAIQEAIGSMDHWIDHDEIQFVDHDGDELIFHSEAQLLGWH